MACPLQQTIRHPKHAGVRPTPSARAPQRAWAPCFRMERPPLLTSFQDFGLADPISRALKEENYVTPTPIQAQTIPIALTGRDVVGIAQTGTGKTASFALPILHRLLENRVKPQPKTCRVLVLSPTRELSGQILESFNAYGRHMRLTSALAIGGVPMGRQVRSLMQGVDVMVATPGRLLDLVQSNGLKLSQRRVPRARRSRPHARHGLHQRHPQNRRQAAAQAPDPVLLGHHAEGHRRSRGSDAARSCQRRGDAGLLHGRAHHPAHPPGRFHRQAHRAGQAAEAGAGQPRSRLHPHQAWRRQGREGPRQGRHQG